MLLSTRSACCAYILPTGCTGNDGKIDGKVQALYKSQFIEWYGRVEPVKDDHQKSAQKQRVESQFQATIAHSCTFPHRGCRKSSLLPLLSHWCTLRV